jgi:hypothetical protein
MKVPYGGDVICFEVSLNGERLCLASVGEAGVLTQILSWSVAAPEDRAPDYESDSAPVHLQVGGMTPNRKHVHWLGGLRDVHPGDSITIRVVEAERPDAAGPLVEEYIGS